jgi:hypothetical protein
MLKMLHFYDTLLKELKLSRLIQKACRDPCRYNVQQIHRNGALKLIFGSVRFFLSLNVETGFLNFKGPSFLAEQ